jgi:Amt family ammonium transporter
MIAAIGAVVAAEMETLLLRLRIDDAIGAVPVHLGAGIWGTLAVALFAPPEAISQLGRWHQFGIQLLGVLTIGAFCCAMTFAALLAYRRFQSLRVSPRDEIIGLNIAEHGATTSLLDLLGQMDVQAHTGDFSRPVSVEVESEASQVAAFYNAVLEKFNLEIDRRKMAMQRLSDLANHDALTGLGNRRYLFERLRRVLAMASAEHPGALLYLDLDGFKRINDLIGHDAGDFMLKQVARWLRQSAGQEALIVRLGGDEFAIVLTDLARPRSQATTLAREVIERLNQVVDYGEHHLYVGVSIGIALFGEDRSETVKDLLRRADEAMYAAKLAGKGTLHVHGLTEEA